jgi:hypothetical protein
MPHLRVRAAPVLRLTAQLLLCATLVGCLAYRNGPLPRGGGLRVAEPGTKTIAVTVKVDRTVNGEPREFPDYVRERWIEATLKAYRDSGLFADVRRGVGGDTDLRASVDIEDDVAGSEAYSFLSALSLLVLPSRSRDQIQLRTTYRDRSGATVGDFRSREVVTTWFQLFLLPLTPFASRDGVVESTIRDLSLATAKRAQTKGIF